MLKLYNTSSVARKFMDVSNYFLFVFFDQLKKKILFTLSWLTAWQDAMSYRFSHYFITFLSQTLMLLAGFNDQMITSRFWGYQLVRPWLIEVPRSLVQVVVQWNIATHNWLKTCKFFKLHTVLLTTFMYILYK